MTYRVNKISAISYVNKDTHDSSNSISKVSNKIKCKESKSFSNILSQIKLKKRK